MQRRASTMREVAAHAGVSLKTVSRVVNGESGVSPALVARVRASVDALGYRHNLAASNLRGSRRTRSIGVLLQDVANDFSAATLRAVDDFTAESKVAVFTASLDEEPGRERDLVQDLISRRVDGLILMPATTEQSYLRHDVERGLSIVVIDRRPYDLDVDSVLVDNVGGARAAVTHLAERGHQRIAMIADSTDIWTSGMRAAGYAKALAAHGIDPDQRLVHTGVRTAEQSARATEELLARPHPPTALFTARNSLTIGAVRALHQSGRADSVALVGFDDFPLADLLRPGITVVHQRPELVGRRAAGWLLERIDGYTDPPRHEVLPATLVERGSGEIPPHA